MKSFIYIVVFSIWLITSVANAYGQTADTTFAVIASINSDHDEMILKILHGNKNLQAIRIHDAIGKEVTYIDVSAQKGLGTSSITINISALKPGIYFCSIYSDKGLLETKRIYKVATR